MSLGPVIGNRFSDAQRATPKPHLRERLTLLASRSTPLGNVATGSDGRLSFAPIYVPHGWDRSEAEPRRMPRCALQPGQRVRVNATVAQLQEQHVFPFVTPAARAVAGREGIVVECLESLALTLVVVALDSKHWTFVPEYLAPVPPAEGDDERDAMASDPAFDPYSACTSRPAVRLRTSSTNPTADSCFPRDDHVSEPLTLGDTVQGMTGPSGV